LSLLFAYFSSLPQDELSVSLTTLRVFFFFRKETGCIGVPPLLLLLLSLGARRFVCDTYPSPAPRFFRILLWLLLFFSWFLLCV
jgi:hypothetical protein